MVRCPDCTIDFGDERNLSKHHRNDECTGPPDWFHAIPPVLLLDMAAAWRNPAARTNGRLAELVEAIAELVP